MKTTRELAKEESHKQLVQNLQELLAKNYDANKGFIKAMKETQSHDLKEYLKVRALIHHRYATQLDKIIHSLNEHPIEEGSTVGRFHRAWMDIIHKIGGNSDETIFDECLRGQAATIKEYNNKLTNYKFPTEIKEVLKSHLAELEQIYESAKKIEDVT